MSVAARLTSTIDQANVFLAASVMPLVVQSISLEADARIAVVTLRYDDGGLSKELVAAQFLSPTAILEAATRSFLLDWCHVALCDDFDAEDDSPEPLCVAYGTGMTPDPVNTHRDQTHSGPERAQ